jgi:hypothetical protein
MLFQLLVILKLPTLHVQTSFLVCYSFWKTHGVEMLSDGQTLQALMTA